MSLTSEVQDLIAGHQIAARRANQPLPQPCIIVNASYDAKLGTCKVWLGHELIQYTDSGELVPPEQIPTYGPFPIATQSIGMQGAPVGGERGFLFPVQGGGLVVLAHYDDSPGVSAGEWIHQLPAQPTTSFYDLRNDGSATHSATTKAIVTGPLVLLGETQQNGTDGIVRFEDLQDAIFALRDAVQAALNQLAQMVQSGSGVPPPTVEHTAVSASFQCFAAKGSPSSTAQDPTLQPKVPNIPSAPTGGSIP